MSIRTLLVDDHQMMRDGLRAILDKEPDVEVVGVADNGRTAFEKVQELFPAVVVMDIGMPGLNGIEATRKIKLACPTVKVIALSTYSDKRYVVEMLDAGASGYVLKIAASDDLLQAIRAVSDGKHYLSPDITGIVLDRYTRHLFPVVHSAQTVLSPREREVLQLLAEGKSSKQVAARLHMSIKTADTHRRNIMAKLDLHTVAELTKYAVREGLTSVDG